MSSRHLENKNLLMRQTRRTKQKLNKTETAVLCYLVRMTTAENFGYSVYSSYPKLLSFVGKSQQQTNRALRHLEELGRVTSSHSKPFRGAPVLFSLTFPQWAHAKRLLGRAGGNLVAYYADLKYYVDAYIKRTHNPMTSTEVAWHFNVSKRTAQKALQQLVTNGVLRRTRIWRWSRRRRKYVKIPAYELTKGQKPITHWIENELTNNSG